MVIKRALDLVSAEGIANNTIRSSHSPIISLSIACIYQKYINSIFTV